VIVVSNTSPLTNLAAIGQFDLLHELYGDLHVAEAVQQELNFGEARWPGAKELAVASWIQVHPVINQSLILTLSIDLDLGEAASIALATELQANLILLDEIEARHFAQRLNLKFTGVLGVLLEAKSKHLIADIRPLLDLLRNAAGFYLSDSLYQRVLELAHE